MFIELHTSDGRERMLNTDHISMVIREDDNVFVNMDNGGLILVTETYEEVKDELSRYQTR